MAKCHEIIHANVFAHDIHESMAFDEYFIPN